MSFTCQAGLVVENERRCEHCGQTDMGVCGRLPTILQERVDRLLAALKLAIKVADEAREEWDKAPAGMRAGKILIALSGGIPRYRADTDEIHAAIIEAEGVEAGQPSPKGEHPHV